MLKILNKNRLNYEYFFHKMIGLMKKYYLLIKKINIRKKKKNSYIYFFIIKI